MDGIEGRFLIFSIKWYLFEEVSQEKFVIKSLQVVVSLFEIACILPFPGETSWLKMKQRQVRGLWQGSWGGLSEFPLNSIS